MKGLKEKWLQVVIALLVALNLVIGVASLMVAPQPAIPAGVGAQSVSGYAFRLEDGAGDEIFSIDDSGNTDVAGRLNYGSNGMYPLGYASSGQELVCATTTITGENQSVTVSGITTVTYGVAWLITDPGTGAGDPWMVTTDAAPGDGTIVVNVWQDDASAATSGAVIGYCAIGTE